MKKVLLTLFFVCAANLTLLAQCTGIDDIGGTVFRDFNLNGLIDASEPGIEGITVMAYDASGTAVASTTTDASGNYTLVVGAGVEVRIEFSGWPGYWESAPFGTNSATSVSMATSPYCNHHFGLNDPSEFCSADPGVGTTCFVSGDPLGGGTAGSLDVLVSFPYSSTNFDPATQEVVSGIFGSVWGLAWQRESNTMYSAAFVKRHSGLASLGTGGIYATNTVLNIDVPFVDLQTIGVNTGNFVNPRGLPANAADASADPEAFDAVGKLGLGDIDLSSDNATLWAVNLFERTLVELFVDNPTTVIPTAAEVTVHPIPDPGCSDGEYRPFAVKYHRDRVYVGVVCSAETSQNAADLEGHVYEFDPATAGFTNVLSFPLDFRRGYVNSHPSNPVCEFWNPWTNDFNDFLPVFDPGERSICYPQPMLSDIEFDVDGSMILGFMDRTGHQTGYDNLNTDPTSDGNALYRAQAGGDVLRAGFSGGVYTIENAGTTDGTNGCGPDPAGMEEGPGGGEYYCGDFQILSGTGWSFEIHQEISVGGLAFLPGSNEIMYSAMDPVGLYSGGIAWMDNTTGESTDRYELFNRNDQPGATYAGKANGIGDVELMCPPAPIEIGNYLWVDLDGDGIQDPGEPPLAGITVHLYDDMGNLVGTAVTDSNGQYYFNDTNVGEGIDINANYFVTLDPAQFSGGVLTNGTSTYNLTTSDTGMGGDPNVNDSDPLNDNASGITFIDSNGLPYIPVSTGNAGQNNHSYDFGFTVICPVISGVSANVADDQCYNGAAIDVTYTVATDMGTNGTEYTIVWYVDGVEQTGQTGDQFVYSLTPIDGCTPLSSPLVEALLFCTEQGSTTGSQVANSSAAFTVYPTPQLGTDYTVVDGACTVSIVDDCGSLMITNDQGGTNEHTINTGDADVTVTFTISSDAGAPAGCEVIEQLTATCPCPAPSCVGITISGD